MLKSQHVIYALYLIALAAFILAGYPLATFHGDEAMQIYMSHDYATAFIYGSPDQLKTSPPYPIDSDQHLRLINGSFNRYAIGLSWQVAGLNTGDLPPRPGWDWGLSYTDNAATHHRPSEALLNAARFSSALLLALSAWVMFGIGWQIGGARAAVIASALYALNPAILLNGRRAMQEGSMLFFGLLCVFAAARLGKVSRPRNRIAVLALLALAGGLTAASKHNGVVFVAAAFAWAALDALVKWLRTRGTRQLLALFGGLLVAGVLAVALFIALSPALWTDPIARVGDLLAARGELLDIQVAVSPDAPISLSERVSAIFVQPFAAPQHFEVASWGEAAPIVDEIARYMASPLSGVQVGVTGAVVLNVLVWLVGMIAAVAARRFGLLAWLALAVLLMLANPLPWQRYYLPLIPPVVLLAALGASACMGLILTNLRQRRATRGV